MGSIYYFDQSISSDTLISDYNFDSFWVFSNIDTRHHHWW